MQDQKFDLTVASRIRNASAYDLTAQSRAVDAGSCQTPDDQRGVERPYGADCDIGAIEYDPASTDERQAAESVLPFAHNCDIVGDKGFIGEEWQAEQEAYRGNRIWTPKRTNQHQQNPEGFDQWLNAMRERLEGAFNEVQNTGRNLERSLRKTVIGLATHMIAKMTSHLLKRILCRQFGIDVQSFTTSVQST